MTECQHDENELNYVTHHADAERRTERGEKQRRCPACGLWVWEPAFWSADDR